MSSKRSTSKFQKVYPSETINTKNHWAVGTIWQIKDYNIEMTDKGFTCSCPAFKKCKHIVQIEEGFE